MGGRIGRGELQSRPNEVSQGVALTASLTSSNFRSIQGQAMELEKYVFSVFRKRLQYQSLSESYPLADLFGRVWLRLQQIPILS